MAALKTIACALAFATLAAAAARAQSPTELAQGQKLFAMHCAFCHGPGGEGGRGPTLAQPTLPRASDADSLMRIIRRGIEGTEMPGFRFEPAEVAALAAFVRSLGNRPREQVPGDPARGAQLYATKGACATCHSVRGHGGSIGPDLTEIGRQRSAASLRRALLEPAAEVPQSFNAFRADAGLPLNFMFVRVVTRDGRHFGGVRVNEDTFSVLLRDLGGRLHSFFKSELAEFHKDAGFSPMPAYGGVFTPGELDDVIAYLVSLRGAPVRPPTEGARTDRTNTVTH